MRRLTKILQKLGFVKKIVIEFGGPEYEEKLVFGNDVIFNAFESYLKNYMVDLTNNRKFDQIEAMRNFRGQLLADRDTFKDVYKDEESKKPIEEQMEKIQGKMIQV